MESLSKNRLDAEQINALTQYAFGQPAEAVTENHIGEFSALYVVKLAEKEVVLKVAPKDTVRVLRYEKHAMQTEVEALRVVRANTSVPVPAVLFYDATKSQCDFSYVFMEKMDGENLNSLSSNLSAAQSRQILLQLGAFNRQINGIEHDTFGSLVRANQRYGDWRTAFTTMCLDVLEDGKDAGAKLPISYDTIWDTVDSYAYACDDVKRPKLVHWDLWSGNVLIQGERITGILDFERSIYADPLMEYFFRKEAISADFCVGYGIDLSALGQNARIRLALYDLYLALIRVVEYHYREYGRSEYSWREEGLIAAYQAFEI